MQAATSKIQEQGNTTIPQSVRDYLKLDTGASIVYFESNGKVEIQKQIDETQKQIDETQKLRDEMRKQASSQKSRKSINILAHTPDFNVNVKEETSKIQEQGNTTIPQSVRVYLELDRGASIVYTFDPNGKVEIQKQDSFNAIDLSIDGDDNTIS
jgi:bifunctional DNA-binding transcriptional regulator/antitoxin component of YhaV-PrlF toxin-antitoxin module